MKVNYKRMKNNLFHLVLLILIAGACGTGEGYEQVPEADGFKALSIDLRFNTPLNYSRFIDSIVYIPLETPENALIGANVFKIVCAKGRYVVFDETRVFIFDLQGNFLFSFGNQGNGPGELSWATDFIVDPDNNAVEVMSVGTLKVTRFNLLNGSLINEFKAGPHNNLYKRPDGHYIFYGEEPAPENKNLLHNLIFYSAAEDKVYKTALTCPAFIYDFASKTCNTFSEVKGGALFTRRLDNTVYIIKNNDEIKAKYRFDYGQNNLPVRKDIFKKYGDLDGIMEQSGYAVQLFGHFGNESYLYFLVYRNNKRFVVVYDIKHNKLCYGDKVKNDIDNGPDCFVVGIHEDHLIGTIEPTRFIKHFKALSKDLGKDKWVEYLKSHPDIHKILKSVKQQDNQILMLCYLKDQFKDEK